MVIRNETQTADSKVVGLAITSHLSPGNTVFSCQKDLTHQCGHIGLYAQDYQFSGCRNKNQHHPADCKRGPVDILYHQETGQCHNGAFGYDGRYAGPIPLELYRDRRMVDVQQRSGG